MSRSCLTVNGGSQPASVTLVIHPGALGDVILLGHLAGALGGAVHLAAGLEKTQLLRGLGRVSECIDFAALPMHELFMDGQAGKSELSPRLGRCGRLISFLGEAGSTEATRLVGLTGAREAHFLPVRPPVGWRGHLTDAWTDQMGLRRSARAAGAWPVPSQWREAATSVLRCLGVSSSCPLAVIHPGSGSVAKNWPIERFAAVAAEVEGLGLTPVLLIGPAELERGLTWPGRTIATLRCQPLSTLAGLLSFARIFIGNDSGIAHLSASVGCRTIALFSVSDPVGFAPLGTAATTIAGSDSTQPTYNKVLEAVSLALRLPQTQKR